MQWLDWLYYIILLVVMFAGLAINLIGLPGLWLLYVGVLIYSWWTGWNVYAGWTTAIVLLVLGLLAEVAEFVAGAAGSKKAGGTRRGMIGAIVGGLVGGIVLTPFIPIPVVGTIAGACAGSFAGAALVEILIDPNTGRAMTIGVGAAKGRLLGIIVKSGFGLAMLLFALFKCLPIHPNRPTQGALIPTPNPAATMPSQDPPPSPLSPPPPATLPVSSDDPASATSPD